MIGKFLKRILGGAVALLVLFLIVAWLGLRASLPALDGEVAVTSIDAVVMIERDVNGIPVITASNRYDLAYATGYAHGQDRFFQMDLIRRKASGELSELVGAAAVNADKRFRFHRFRARAQAVLDAATEADRA